MNQKEAAKRLDVSAATVSRLASGARKPSRTLIYRVQRLMHWGAAAQLEAIRLGRYHTEFAKHMAQTEAGDYVD